MITIEEKINLFTKIVYEKVEKENKEAIKKFEEEYVKIIDQKKEEFKKRAEELEYKTASEIEKIKVQTLSKAHIKGKRMLLETRNKIYNTALKDIIDFAKQINNSIAYREYFSDKLNKLINNYDIQEAHIIITQADWNLWYKDLQIKSNKNLSVEFDDNIIGGFILIDKQNNVKYDFSIGNLVEANREKIGEKLFSLL
ncbi:V-type ATP synthase subunit E [Thermobrachium celere]|uniref:V-type ATP synthase subunit E n=1 Tax=Thermobrachium celere TaxID=53422 RepID=UPI00194380AB|nr:V-type ATP synthase subunit E [Thermobrachium celere]GFR34412.1 hypothetical protein TCEA9_02240 [Thermobrachium celere]